MKTNLSLTVLLAVFPVAGCDSKPVHPEVTAENCRNENIAKLDPSLRQTFADTCVRSGVFKPVANDETCKDENIAKLDPSLRQHFADACFRRGTFKPSSGKTW